MQTSAGFMFFQHLFSPPPPVRAYVRVCVVLGFHMAAGAHYHLFI